MSFGLLFFFFSSRRRHTRLQGDWSSDVCSSDLCEGGTWRRRCSPMAQRGQQLGGRNAGPDRKSTRLNSSHLVISYAVFCLKKKKNKNDQSRRGRCNEQHELQRLTLDLQRRSHKQ